MAVRMPNGRSNQAEASRCALLPMIILKSVWTKNDIDNDTKDSAQELPKMLTAFGRELINIGTIHRVRFTAD